LTAHLRSVLGVRIAGSGAAFPSDIDPNEVALDNETVWPVFLGEGWRAELKRRGWRADHANDAWGVRRRHVWRRPAAPGSSHAEALALAAARSAIDRAGWTARELQAIVVATSTPPHISSSLAARLAGALETDAAAFDVRAGGASGLAALSQAALLVSNGVERVLVVAVESVPEFLEPDDIKNRLLFSCAAGALAIGAAPGEQCGLVASRAGRVQATGQAFTIPGSLPPQADQRYTFQDADPAYLESLGEAWGLSIEALCEISRGSIDYFLPYAVTRGQLERAHELSGFEVTLALDSLRENGCTGCANLVLQVHALLESSELLSAQTLGLVTVGGGVSWQAIVWRI
jgi:3-oxoacyl-[acyl-carrier-protein] synthase III